MTVASVLSMQSVIGGYDIFEDAQQAVRSLERHQISIQDVVIADQKVRSWRVASAEPRSKAPGLRLNARFLVLMRGELTTVTRARDLLSAAQHAN